MQPAQTQRSNRRRLRLALGELGSRPRRFEPAADPGAVLGRYTECRPEPTFSFGLTPTKNIRAFLRYLSFQKIPSYGTYFTLGRPRLRPTSQIVVSIAFCIGQHAH